MLGTQVVLQRLGLVILRRARCSQKAGYPRESDARPDDTGACEQAGNTQAGRIPDWMCYQGEMVPWLAWNPILNTQVGLNRWASGGSMTPQQTWCPCRPVSRCL